jgi:hypothetical protein
MLCQLHLRHPAVRPMVPARSVAILRPADLCQLGGSAGQVESSLAVQRMPEFPPEATAGRASRAPPSPPADGSFFYIPLTQGQHAMVDAEDYERVSRCKWCLSRSSNQLYAPRRCRGKTIRMHQFIMNPPKGMVVDHIDGNGLNNRRDNLRICTSRQNAWNHKRRKEADASSQYIGVYPCQRPPDKWYVKIQCNGDGTYLGPFDTAIEAARARDRKAIELFGEYARLNFPREEYTGGQTTEDG